MSCWIRLCWHLYSFFQFEVMPGNFLVLLALIFPRSGFSHWSALFSPASCQIFCYLRSSWCPMATKSSGLLNSIISDTFSVQMRFPGELCPPLINSWFVSFSLHTASVSHDSCFVIHDSWWPLVRQRFGCQVPLWSLIRFLLDVFVMHGLEPSRRAAERKKRGKINNYFEFCFPSFSSIVFRFQNGGGRGMYLDAFECIWIYVACLYGRKSSDDVTSRY